MAATSPLSVIPLQLLGQGGCRLAFPNATVYIDPYLSNSVQELDAPDLNRLVPAPFRPEDVTDAAWVLITHEHIDHCDPHTLPVLAQASPQCRFIGPPPVIARLASWNIPSERVSLAAEAWMPLQANLRVHAIPAAHPSIQRDANGNAACVGYLLEFAGRRLYLAGDTSVTEELIDALLPHRPIGAALLPVNEHNFFRGRRRIIGNMSVREAFQLAEELGIEQVIPVHWDMFAINAAYPEEIEAIYKRMRPSFDLLLHPESLRF